MIKSSKVKQDKERKGYKFRLNVPNSDIERQLTKIVGSCRFVWNKALALVKQEDDDYRTMLQMSKMNGGDETGITTFFKFNPYNQLSALLTEWKQQPETEFLKEAYSKSLQIVLEELGQAVAEAKSKTNPKRYPVFKRRGVKDSFSWNGTVKHDAENGRIFIPKIGVWLSYTKSREVFGVVKNVTISKQSGHWYVSLQTERPLSQINPEWININKVIGIDVGIAKAVSASDEISFEYQGKQISSKQLDSINPLREHQAKLAKLQKDLAGKTKFSRNWSKQKAKISKLHSKIANIRNDFVHKATTAISKSYAYVAVEALKVKNMSKSAKGTADKHGKMVKQKSGLNKSILDQGWGMFRQFLAYKLKYNYGTELIEVNSQYTSQKCSGCGHIHADNRKNQASFKCVKCELSMNADFNASLNIKAAGLVVLACGVDGMPSIQNATMKQEPTELASSWVSNVGILVL
jgi:putative transposase